jgi:dipeptidyl aminopeptidase/acylaminoacyl peptidase
VDHGFAVVLVNYRGSSGYGRTWRDALLGDPGFPELADIAAVRAWVVERGIADPARTVLAGGSWDGYLTLLGLGTQPRDWAAGLASVPIGDFRAAYEDMMPMLKDFARTLFGGTPDEQPELYRERSPITYVPDVRAPVLILAGENDPRCPLRQVERYVGRLAALGKPYEVYRFDAGHGSPVVDEQVRQCERMLDFLARHLGTPEPAE